MKRTILISALLLASLFASAQTQQGYVKTKGRLDANGNLIPGQGLKGATVFVHGRNSVLVNAEDGTFSFPVVEPQYRLDSVKKTGYQLVDMDAVFKTYTQSTNPLFLVMETKDKQLNDQIEAERKIRRALTNQLRQREDEIEELKEQQKISDKEYHEALQKLFEDVGHNERLVKDMAKRYSELDYDQLDEFYRQVSYYIENGELTKADSLLGSKGDVTSQVKEEIQKGQVLQNQEVLINKAKEVHAASVEELACRCYSYYETFAAQHLNDTAAYFLELRASLDTANIEWQRDAGLFLGDYLADYEKALGYFELGLRQSIRKYGEQHYWTATCYNDIGLIYDERGDFNKAIEYLEKALTIELSYLGNDTLEVANTYNSLGQVYSDLGDHNRALGYYNKALAIRKTRLEENHASVGFSYNNVGAQYLELGDYSNALEYLNNAVSILTQTYGEEHRGVAICYTNIGLVFDKQYEYSKAIEYYNKAIGIQECVLGKKHPDVAVSYINLGSAWEEQGYFDKALELYNKGLDIEIAVFGEKHPFVATCYNNMGRCYGRKGEFIQAYENYNKALEIRLFVFGENNPEVAIIYNNIGGLCFANNKYDLALESFEKAVRILEVTDKGIDDIVALANCYSKMGDIYGNKGDFTVALEFLNKSLKLRIDSLGSEDPDVGESYNNLGFFYFYLEDYIKAVDCFERALAISEKQLGTNHQDVASSYHNIGYVLNIMGDHEKSLLYLNKALSIRQIIFDSEHPRIADSYNCIGNVYAAMGDYDTALVYYNKAFIIREKTLEEDDPDYIKLKNKIFEIQTKLKEREDNPNE